MMPLHYIVLIICLLLLVFLCRKEWMRPNRKRLAARLLASLLAVLSLAYLILPIGKERQVTPAKTVFQSIDTPTGITAIYWPRQISAGSALQVQGLFNNKGNHPVKLLLSGFNERLDSVTIPAQQQQSFIFNTRPKQAGRALYSLIAVAKDTIEKETIPLEVVPLKPLKVLLLAAAPDFEHKFLAGWLSQNGYMVAARTAISKNKYSYTYLDTTRFPLEQLTPALLNAFDVLVADAGALAALNARELAAIRTQVADKGLGLLVKTDSGAVRNFYNQPFPLTATADKSERPVTLQLAGTTAMLRMEAPVYITSTPGTQALVTDAQQHILAGSSLYGSGKLVNTTLHTTYSWLLAGNRESYQNLWSLLLQKAARTKPHTAQWFIGTALPRVRMPVTLRLETSMPQPTATINGARLSLAQDAVLPFQWQGVYWPMQAGWQAAVAASGDTCHWYAFDERAWQPIAVGEQQHRGSITAAGADASTLPEIYIVILLLLALTFLWVEEKMV
ncbi:hypothetical protein [Chitinophaga sp. GbtcB8]|uniref:hypothetical protein n=1 Tax=Chitinophaga sp. GbtcB8 TaxID=2824753 RepID=UPI001C30B4A1|nr:hypothetical protein [Chitinophaga sp. GbtcB8]